MTLFTAPVARRTTASVVAGVSLAGAAAVAMSAPAQAADTGIPVLEAIKQCESGGDYTAKNPNSSAAGAYQFLTRSWQALDAGAGYPTADVAPASVQDAAAKELYAQLGTKPWAPSQHCWGGTVAAQSSSVVRQSGTSTAAADTAAAERAAAQKAAAEKAAAQRAAAAERRAAQQERAAERAEAQRAAAAARVSAAEKAAAAQANAENKVELDAAADTVFVKPGDTLSTIARENNVQGGWKALFKANKHIIEDADLIFVGQELVLPTA